MNNEEFSMKLNEIKERVLSSSTPEDESKYTESLFESIKHIDKQKNEFWYARELQAALEYKEWRNFTKVIDRAITACENSENAISPHFVELFHVWNTFGCSRKGPKVSGVFRGGNSSTNPSS